MVGDKRGLLAVFGAFLIQLCIGCYHGTFGNLLPYLTSYMRQFDPDLTHGDLAMIFSTGGLSQGLSYLLGGLILVPLIGSRRSLIFGSVLFVLAPVLTYFSLNVSVPLVSCTYGLLNGFAVNVVMLVTTVMPVSWFPDHRGKVIGFVNGGFGLASTVFSPVQSLLVNPHNVSPVSTNTTNSTGSYFTDPEVLDNVPYLLLYMSAIYAVILSIGAVLVVEKDPGKVEMVDLKRKLSESFSFLYHQTFTRLDFYLLWLTRLLFLTIDAGALAHWKTFSFTQSDNDKLVTIAGGVSGVANWLSRLLAGLMLDQVQFRVMMSIISLLLTINLASIYFIGQQSFIGLIISVWLVYLLGFAHFSTIPAQTLSLFPGAHGHVVLGAIGLAETFSYAGLGVINLLIMSNETSQTFLVLFLTLAAFSLLAVPITAAVSDVKKTETLS